MHVTSVRQGPGNSQRSGFCCCWPGCRCDRADCNGQCTRARASDEALTSAGDTAACCWPPSRRCGPCAVSCVQQLLCMRTGDVRCGKGWASSQGWGDTLRVAQVQVCPALGSVHPSLRAVAIVRCRQGATQAGTPVCVPRLQAGPLLHARLPLELGSKRRIHCTLLLGAERAAQGHDHGATRRAAAAGCRACATKYQAARAGMHAAGLCLQAHLMHKSARVGTALLARVLGVGVRIAHPPGSCLGPLRCLAMTCCACCAVSRPRARQQDGAALCLDRAQARSGGHGGCASNTPKPWTSKTSRTPDRFCWSISSAACLPGVGSTSAALAAHQRCPPGLRRQQQCSAGGMAVGSACLVCGRDASCAAGRRVLSQPWVAAGWHPGGSHLLREIRPASRAASGRLQRQLRSSRRVAGGDCCRGASWLPHSWPCWHAKRYIFLCRRSRLGACGQLGRPPAGAATAAAGWRWVHPAQRLCALALADLACLCRSHARAPRGLGDTDVPLQEHGRVCSGREAVTGRQLTDVARPHVLCRMHLALHLSRNACAIEGSIAQPCTASGKSHLLSSFLRRDCYAGPARRPAPSSAELEDLDASTSVCPWANVADFDCR